jgi:hypothetical protein
MVAYTNANITVDNELGSNVRGQKYADGTAAVGTYQTGGVNFNLTNVFKPSSQPRVVVDAMAGGYGLEYVKHSTAVGGLVKAYYSSGNALNGASFIIPLVEVANAANLAAVNFKWHAFGQAY